MAPIGCTGAMVAANRRSSGEAQCAIHTEEHNARFRKGSSATSIGDSALCETLSCSTSDSKLSALALLKQQAQRTGGLFRKFQNAASQKIAKGVKMVAGPVSTHQEGSILRITVPDDSALAVAMAQAEAAPSQDDGNLDSELIATFQQMGFEKTQVTEAIAALGGMPSDSDDLLQVLLAQSESAYISTHVGAELSQSPPLPSAVVEICSSREQQPAAFATFGGTRAGAELPRSPPPLPPPSSPPSPSTQTLPTSSLSPLPARSAVGSAEFERNIGHIREMQHVPHPAAQVHTCKGAVFEVLRQMGFADKAIEQAVTFLGTAADLKDVIVLLHAMGSLPTISFASLSSSSASASSACAVASTADSQVDAVMNPLVIEGAPQRNLTPIAEIIKEPEPLLEKVVEHNSEMPTLAATVVGMVFDRIAAKMVKEEDSCEKHLLEDAPNSVSPTRGGA